MRWYDENVSKLMSRRMEVALNLNKTIRSPDERAEVRASAFSAAKRARNKREPFVRRAQTRRQFPMTAAGCFHCVYDASTLLACCQRRRRRRRRRCCCRRRVGAAVAGAVAAAADKTHCEPERLTRSLARRAQV